MKQTAQMGKNKTGMAAAQQRSEAMLKGRGEFLPASPGSAQAIANVRVAYAKNAEPMGSIPQPVGLKDKAQTAVKAVKGQSPSQFLDKLGERLAFEQAGTRLYEGLLSKHDAFGTFAGGPSREELEHFLGEEYQHFKLLQRVIDEFGGDPTAVTPSANLQATASSGINKVIVDPRTTLLQSLEAILVAELADTEGWEMLGGIAREAGEDKLFEEFEKAKVTERDHLTNVRKWLLAGQGLST